MQALDDGSGKVDMGEVFNRCCTQHKSRLLARNCSTTGTPVIVLCFLIEWEAVVVEIVVKEALEVVEVATVVEEEVATVEVVVEATMKLLQGTLVEDSRCTDLQLTQNALCSIHSHAVQCTMRPS